MEDKVRKITSCFVDAINSHDVTAILNMMTLDHVFVDSLGDVVEGLENLQKAWTQYVELFPDYKVVMENLMVDGNMGFVLGKASGTKCVNGEYLDENHWEISIGWKSIIENGRVKEWQVCCNNQTLFEILGTKNFHQTLPNNDN